MLKLINLLASLCQLVTYLLEKYDAKRRKEKYEKTTANPNSEWVNGFGVRSETKDSDPTKTHSGELYCL